MDGLEFLNELNRLSSANYFSEQEYEEMTNCLGEKDELYNIGIIFFTKLCKELSLTDDQKTKYLNPTVAKFVNSNLDKMGFVKKGTISERKVIFNLMYDHAKKYLKDLINNSDTSEEESQDSGKKSH